MSEIRSFFQADTSPNTKLITDSNRATTSRGLMLHLPFRNSQGAVIPIGLSGFLYRLLLGGSKQVVSAGASPSHLGLFHIGFC
jgi:hypothetical protein